MTPQKAAAAAAAAAAAPKAPLHYYYTALIRTHHITSRKKLQRVRKAAAQHAVPYVLVRSGGSPGIMYAEAAAEVSVAGWVAAVQALRYKDFQCVQKPAEAESAAAAASASAAASAPPDFGGVRVPGSTDRKVGFEEVTSTTEFADRLREKGLLAWFKEGMGYI
ncbi:hypothetical protein MN608_09887 [Microdochium nivale]|nr:hypothetical protein MN608_09887 [Microdochium nivale]